MNIGTLNHIFNHFHNFLGNFGQQNKQKHNTSINIITKNIFFYFFELSTKIS